MSRKWLEKLIEVYLPEFAQCDDSETGRAKAKELADSMKERWSRHGLKELKQQKNLMADVRNAIKTQLGPDHVSLSYMAFTREEWIQINNSGYDQVSARNQNINYLSDDAINALVTRATKLLLSREWSDIAAGLAVLTGRRSTEVLATAKFEYKTPYSVVFTGSLKRKEGQSRPFEIQTLCQAEYVINAIEKLRSIKPADGMTAEEINQKWSQTVASKCNEHFKDLVPLREGREKLYTHLCRSVYAAIATYWYCPPSVVDIEFKAAIQGHFAVLDEKDPTIRLSTAAARHYSDYKAEGGKQGIKLDQPEVKVIEMFQLNKDEGELKKNVDGGETMSKPENPLNQQNLVATIADISNLNLKLEAELEEAREEIERLRAEVQQFQQFMPVIQALQAVQGVTQPQPQSPAPVKVEVPKVINLPQPKTPQPEPAQPTQTDRSISTKAKVNAIIDAIIAHNDTPGRSHEDKRAISHPVIKALGKPIGATYQTAITKVLAERLEEISEHHAKHGLSKAHNRGKSYEVIQFDYSGVA